MAGRQLPAPRRHPLLSPSGDSPRRGCAARADGSGKGSPGPLPWLLTGKKRKLAAMLAAAAVEFGLTGEHPVAVLTHLHELPPRRAQP